MHAHALTHTCMHARAHAHTHTHTQVYAQVLPTSAVLMGSVSILQDVIDDLIAQMAAMKCIAHVG